MEGQFFASLSTPTPRVPEQTADFRALRVRGKLHMAQLEDADIGSEVAPAEADDASKQRVDMLVEVRRADEAMRGP